MVSYHVYAESWYWKQLMAVGNRSSSVYTRGPYKYMGTVSGSNDSVAIVNAIRNIPEYIDMMGCRKCDRLNLSTSRKGEPIRYHIFKDGREWIIAEYDKNGRCRNTLSLSSVNVKKKDADMRIKKSRWIYE